MVWAEAAEAAARRVRAFIVGWWGEDLVGVVSEQRMFGLSSTGRIGYVV